MRYKAIHEIFEIICATEICQEKVDKEGWVRIHLKVVLEQQSKP